MSSDFNPSTGKFPENHPLRGPFRELPSYEDLKAEQADTADAIQRAHEALARQAAAQKEAMFVTAVDNALGKGNWTMDSLHNRIMRQTYGASDIEVVELDGKPILQYGPLKVEPVRDPETGSETLHASQYIEILNGQDE